MGRMNEVPTELNWVEKRAACSAAQVFKDLHSEIERDVAVANEVNTIPGPFMVSAGTGGAVIVSVKNEVGPRIVFYFGNDRIEVKDERSNVKIVASPTLNNSGRCVLKVEGVELEQWQFRKMVLETYLFGEIEN